MSAGCAPTCRVHGGRGPCRLSGCDRSAPHLAQCPCLQASPGEALRASRHLRPRSLQAGRTLPRGS
eukprot:9765193-Alexandrium_andersonii.AAC.1